MLLSLSVSIKMGSSKHGLLHTLLPFIKCLRVVGLSPFSTKIINEQVVLEPSKLWSTYSALFLVFVTSISEPARQIHFRPFSEIEAYHDIAFKLVTYANGPGLYGSIVLGLILFNKRISYSINSIATFDNEMLEYGIKINHSRWYRYLIYIFCFQLVLFSHDMFFYTIHTKVKSPYLIIYALTIYLTSMLSSSLIIQLIIWQYGLKYRFSLLNSVFERSLTDYFELNDKHKNEYSLKQIEKVNISYALEICRIHRRLCDIVGSLSCLYSLPLMIQLWDYFSVITIDMFLIYWCFEKSFNNIPVNLLVSCCLRDAILLFFLYVEFSSSNSVGVEAEKTGKLLHRSFQNVSEPSEKRIVCVCSLQLLQQKAIVMICNLFPLDTSSFCGFISSMMTFFIICIQNSQHMYRKDD